MAEISFDKNHELYQEDLRYILSTKGIEGIRGKSVLITGATGLIGQCLIDALMKFNARGACVKIYAVGRNKSAALGRLGEYFSSDLFHFIEQNVIDPFPPNLDVDFIIPLASNTHPLAYSQYPVETILTNIKGAENALELGRRCGATILFPSSVEIYGNGNNHSFSEDETGNLNLSTSRSCYTESKRLSEAMCQSYSAEYGVKVKIARLCRTFGPTMLMSDTKASSQFIIKALAHEPIVLKSKGDQFYSYCYVAEAVSALLYIMFNGEYGIPYNISSGQCNVHLFEFAEACAYLAGSDVRYEIPSLIESKGYSTAMYGVLSNERMKSLGWEEAYPYTEALRRTMRILWDSSL